MLDLFARLRALGGVDFSRHEPEERAPLMRMLNSGIQQTGIRFRFRCEICGNAVENDQEMEPLCTGPHWYDEHEPEPMKLIGRSGPVAWRSRQQGVVR